MKALLISVSSCIARCAACAFVVALVCVQASLAQTAGGGSNSTLAQYRERVHSSMLLIDGLASANAEEKRADESSVLAEVRRRLPRTERVVWRDAVHVIDNEWLHAALDHYQKEAASLPAEARTAMLRQVAERLVALEARLTEIERDGATARDKNAEKGRLENILRHPDFNQEAPQGSALQRLIDRLLKSISENMPEGRGIEPGPSPRLSFAAQIFIYALALGIIAYVLWRYREHLLPAGRGRRERRTARVVLGEHLTADETPSDLLNAAEQMARRGDLRGAIRKAYIALLCELGDRHILRLAQHKTNRDYLRAVEHAGHAGLYEQMRPLTYAFERHWYGREQATDADWNDYRTRCHRTLDSELKV